MQITAKANVVLTVHEDETGARTLGAIPKDVHVVVDCADAPLRVHEVWGGKRHFEIVAFSWDGGNTGYAAGTVVRRDGSLGSARVARCAFRIEEIPAEIRSRAADVLTAANRRLDEVVVPS